MTDMPNHIKTELEFVGSKKDIARLYHFVQPSSDIRKHNRNGFSFERIVPLPRFKERYPKKWILTENDHVQPDEKKPWLNWYEARKSLWGTKWDAYDILWTDKRKIEFSTAWHFAEPVVARLSKLFPSIKIRYKYASEDIGNNLGEGVYEGGENTEWTEFSTYSEDAQKFACDMWGIDYEEYRSEQEE